MNPTKFKRKTVGYSIVSFDIFDTLIERTVSLPTDIFYRVGCDILSESEARKFKQSRIDAEHKARNISATGEVTLADIYAQLSGYENEMKPKLMQAEIDKEIECCRRKESMHQTFAAAIESDKKVVLISDMYLPHSCIAAMLNKCGIEGYSKLYLSNEYGCDKISGNLFKQMLNEQQAQAADVIHIGDSIRADYMGAAKVGIKSVLVLRKGWFKRLILSKL